MWIPITLAAATFQILRTSQQHVLRRELSVNVAGFVRYAYGFPMAVIAAFVTFGLAGEPLPHPLAQFWLIVAGAGPVWNRALFTLTAMLGAQTLVNGTQLAITDRHELAKVGRQWRSELPVGLLSLCGSAGWAVAVTLTNAAKVRTLGQVEILIAFAISAFWLHEHHNRSEFAASAVVVLGVIGVIALG